MNALNSIKGINGPKGIEARAGITRARTASTTAAFAITSALGLSPVAATNTPHEYGLRIQGETAQAASSLRYAGLLARVLEIARLPDGWDGQASTRPSAEALSHAREIVRLFSDSVPKDWRGSAPQVAPLSPAGFQFEWKNSGNEIYVACNDDGSLSYLEVTSRGDSEYDGELSALSPALKRFFG